jgi:hypothetical protein
LSCTFTGSTSTQGTATGAGGPSRGLGAAAHTPADTDPWGPLLPGPGWQAPNQAGRQGGAGEGGAGRDARIEDVLRRAMEHQRSVMAGAGAGADEGNAQGGLGASSTLEAMLGECEKRGVTL